MLRPTLSPPIALATPQSDASDQTQSSLNVSAGYINPATNKTVSFLKLSSGTSLAHPPAIPTFLTDEPWTATSSNDTLSSNTTVTSSSDANSIPTSLPYNITFSSWDNSTLSHTSSSSVGYGSFDNPSPTQDAIVVYGPGGGAHLTNFGIAIVVLITLAFIAFIMGVTLYFRRKQRKKHLPKIFSRDPHPTSKATFPRSSYDPGAFAGIGGDDITVTPDETISPSFSPPSTLSLIRQKISIANLFPAVLGPPSSLRKPSLVWPPERAEIAPPPLGHGYVTSPHSSSTHISSARVSTAHASSISGTATNGFEGSSDISSLAPSAFPLPDIVLTKTNPLSPSPPPTSPVCESSMGRSSGEGEHVVVDYEGVGGGYHVW